MADATKTSLYDDVRSLINEFSSCDWMLWQEIEYQVQDPPSGGCMNIFPLPRAVYKYKYKCAQCGRFEIRRTKTY
jgi:hypothetical protein